MRGTGKTKAMVEALPADGCVVVVHSTPLRHYVEQMIHDLRGPEMLARCQVIVARNTADCDRLYGQRRLVEIDHAVHDSGQVPRATLALLDHLVAGIRAMQPA